MCISCLSNHGQNLECPGRKHPPFMVERRKYPHFGSQFKGPARQHGALTGTVREKEDDLGRSEFC